jgi:hypothetical protein
MVTLAGRRLVGMVPGCGPARNGRSSEGLLETAGSLYITVMILPPPPPALGLGRRFVASAALSARQAAMWWDVDSAQERVWSQAATRQP